MKKLLLLISVFIFTFSNAQQQDTISHSIAGKIHFEFNYSLSKIIDKDSSENFEDTEIEIKENEILVLDLYDDCKCAKHLKFNKVRSITGIYRDGSLDIFTYESGNDVVYFNGSDLEKVIISKPLIDNYKLQDIVQCVSGDCENGLGTYIWLEEGWDFINNKEQLYTYQYVGEWKDGNKHGYGIQTNLTYPLDRYLGQWENNQKNGFGTDVFLNVEIMKVTDEYIGQFKDGDIYGQGTWIRKEMRIMHEGEMIVRPAEIETGFWLDWKTLSKKQK